MTQPNLFPTSGNSPDTTAEVRCEEFLREFSRERDFIAAYIRSLLPNAADADDVLQRCSLLLWKKFSDFERDRSFRAWACGVAFYEVRNFVRSANRDRLQFNFDLMEQIADQRIAESSQREAHLSLLQDCLKLLKPRDQDLLRSTYEQSGSQLQEIADSNGLTIRSLSTRLWRLRKMLLDCVHRKLSLEEI